MATYETGHVKNVANLLNYNQFITTLGATYNPSMATITLSALTAMQATAKLDNITKPIARSYGYTEEMEAKAMVEMLAEMNSKQNP
jgi:Holliday junction resolvasome RuvABC ATP-dependent DNA helicase subunit